MSFEYVLENIPDYRFFFINYLLRRFYGLYNSSFDQLSDDERLEKLRSHPFRNTAFMEFQVWSNHDYGTAGIIHPLSEQVLTEPSLLTFQHVAERFKRPV